MRMLMYEEKYLRATSRIFEHIAETADLSFCVKLWDDTLIPLGDSADKNFYISIKGPGILGAVLRKPTLENILMQYASGGIDYHGGDIVEFYQVVRNRGKRTKSVSSSNIKKKIKKSLIFRDFEKRPLILLMVANSVNKIQKFSWKNIGATAKVPKRFCLVFTC